MRLPFRDRRDAGRQLAAALQERGAGPGAVILALPRGGVPVGYEVAAALGAPLDVFIVRKIGAPGHEELAAGAIASGGVRVEIPDVAAFVDRDAFERIARQELAELERREREYRDGRPPADLRGKDVIVVDDGLATGASMRAALTAVRLHRPRRTTVAVPVAPGETRDELRQLADDVICLVVPEPFFAVGAWYQEFGAVTDDEVKRLLAAAGRQGMAPGHA